MKEGGESNTGRGGREGCRGEGGKQGRSGRNRGGRGRGGRGGGRGNPGKEDAERKSPAQESTPEAGDGAKCSNNKVPKSGGQNQAASGAGVPSSQLGGEEGLNNNNKETKKPNPRNRNRKRGKKRNPNEGEQQPQALTEEEKGEKLRFQRAREAEEAAKAEAVERERLCQDYLKTQQILKEELQNHLSTLISFRSTIEWHRSNRAIMTSPTALNEKRQQHTASKKSLKSDLKKCTAFVKKVKASSSFQSNTPTSATSAGFTMQMTEDLANHPLVKDVATLNLSRYVDEIASSLLEAKFKVAEVPVVVALSCALHERYKEFLPSLLPKLVGYIQSPSSQSSPSGTDKDEDAGSITKQRRIFLRLLTEFVLNGIVVDPKPLVKIVAEATGAPKSSAAAHEHQYQVTDANLLSSFVKSAGVELLDTTPRSIRLAMELVSQEIAKDEESDQTELQIDDAEKDEGTQAKAPEQGKPDNSDSPDGDESSQSFVNDPRFLKMKTERETAIKEASDLLVVLGGSVLKERACVPNVNTNLKSHCSGAYASLVASYSATATRLHKLEKRCEQDRLLAGGLSEAREKGLNDARKLLENLRKSVETLSEALDQDVPSVVEETEEEESSALGAGVELWTKGDGEGGDADLGPFNDEETRSFYCDIPDFLSTKPPALLGLSATQVEEKKASNAVRYGGHDNAEEGDQESTPFNEESLRDLHNEKADEDSTKPEEDGETTVDQNAPHFKLSVLLDEELVECNRREVADELADKFCVNHGSNKNSRKRLTKALFNVPRTRLDLLPQYARFACTVDHVYDDVASPLVDDLESQFHGQTKFKKNQHIDGRMKTTRFIGELTKFRAAPPIVALRCLKRCTDDFSGANIDVACCLLESCGRFLYRTKHTKDRLSRLLDTMTRIRKAKVRNAAPCRILYAGKDLTQLIPFSCARSLSVPSLHRTLMKEASRFFNRLSTW
jgi:hypothetical protein